MISKLIYKLFKSTFLKEYAKDQLIPFTFKELKKEFVDLNGSQYYSFSSMAMPLNRIVKAEDYKLWFNNGLTSETLMFFLDEIDKSLDKALTKEKDFAKNMAKISTVTNEMRTRATMVFQSEIIYNILAVQFVREDEDPTNFNNEIHIEKVKAFKELDENSEYAFFLKTPQLNQLLNSLSMSKEKWQDYLKDLAKKDMEYLNQVKEYLSRST